MRKNTLGASDVASLFSLGFKTLSQLVAEKTCPTLTEEEKKVGQLPSVRKGKDLEPLILKKYMEETNEKVYKPTDMYEIMPGLTVNFDGINEIGRPVEFKYVTTYGTKYWTRNEKGVINHKEEFISKASYIGDYIEEQAKYYGVPPYYYTQLQTQIMALKAEAGHLCALFEKDWNLQIYIIPADKRFIRELKVKVKQFYIDLKDPVEVKTEELNVPYEY